MKFKQAEPRAGLLPAVQYGLSYGKINSLITFCLLVSTKWYACDSQLQKWCVSEFMLFLYKIIAFQVKIAKHWNA